MSSMRDTSAWNLCWVPFTGSASISASVVITSMGSASVTIAASSARAKSVFFFEIEKEKANEVSNEIDGGVEQ